MASTQLTEEQLQQSVVLSDEDAEYEDAPAAPTEKASRSTESPTNSNTHEDALSDAIDVVDEERDASIVGEDLEMSVNSDEDSDLSEEESLDDDTDHNFDEEDIDPHLKQDNGEEGSAVAHSPGSSLLDDLEEDEAEGVGAVKIRPGETDDEAELESEHSDSQSDSGNESDGAAAWEEVAEEDEDDEDGSENAPTTKCVFCKQDEEHDPGEEFEEYLTCVGCGDNSHQHCAREAGALRSPYSPPHWKCLECTAAENEAVIEPADEIPYRPNPVPEVELEVSPSSHRPTTSEVAREMLPAQIAPTDPDSLSVFNQPVLDGDRVLRKRKTSSVEADDIVMSLRKRRRNTSKDRESSQGAGASQDAPSEAVERESRRKLRLNPTRKAQAVTIIRRHRSTIVKMRVQPSVLSRLLSKKSASNRKRRESGTYSRRGITAAGSTSFASSDYSHPFYSFLDRETDDIKTKPYGGILSEAEADTSRTLPTNDDRRRFDEAKQKAEEVWRARLQSVQISLGTPAKKSKKSSGPASQIECIDFGGWEIDTWYAAPYPEEYSRNRTLYICEFCLKYMNSDYVAWRHKLKCPAKHPPGDEIYRHGSISVFEVDGRKNPVYCQNLCLLAKLFLGSKTLYYDVEPFLFYVLCEYDALGYHFVGYFSKEKRASSQNNVSCILTLPIHQRKGYGNLLIDFSYLLTRVERKTGSPEKPLSDMGLVSYRNYWRLVLCRYFLDHVSGEKVAAAGLSIRRISDETGLTPDDVISALEGLRCLVRDPHSELYAFRVDLAYCSEYISKWERKNYVKLQPDALTWTPYVMGRGNATNFELGPAISAIAPREEDEMQKPVEESLSVVSHYELASNGCSVDQTVEKPITMEPAPSDVVGVACEDLNENAHPQLDVYESTESQEDGFANEDNEQDVAIEDTSHETLAIQAISRQLVGDDWTALYRDVPPSRFEVYPPPGGRRSDRPRSSASRPAVPRSTSNSSRPRRSVGGSGSTRRSTTSRPKSSSSSSRRKTGGTGRGPGRWPKGTKKSDYGNADSGPGLPPAWIKERARLAALTTGKGSEGEGSILESKETIDVARVQFDDGARMLRVTGGEETTGIDTDHKGGEGYPEDE
ncbi:moz sas family protein [Colletotrichum truncatum]|uniref:Moz sas family protein n=1 Tax=Colletotrichum truncatum TaxID=5467 RepID=A0ACC3YQR1_COLTU|nr:moz sas family protein [Colletotrichum truncatum]KAF6796543.1 moz sas family protein [Colletotrichum truncatum]